MKHTKLFRKLFHVLLSGGIIMLVKPYGVHKAEPDIFAVPAVRVNTGYQ